MSLTMLQRLFLKGSTYRRTTDLPKLPCRCSFSLPNCGLIVNTKCVFASATIQNPMPNFDGLLGVYYKDNRCMMEKAARPL